MILKGSQRAGSKSLALHLLKTEENEHVHVHELRGFVSDDLQSAFQEVYAVSRGTRAKQFLFSLSLNPPAQEKVPVQVFESAIEAIEQKLGLDGQPRAVVFHEKDGRRHAHVVWSRIDTEHMRAINLPHFKMKLRDMSRQLYLENGWQMPRGLTDSRMRDPASYSLAEWQQAKRGGHDPKALKQMFQECWATTKSRVGFEAALKSRGYTLARGDRRGFVAVDYRGEVYAIAKYTGAKTKEVKDRLGDAADLVSVEQAKQAIATRMTAQLREYIRDLETQRKRQAAVLLLRRKETVQRQREQRTQLDTAQRARQDHEARQRAERFSRGVRGVWDWLTGKTAKTRRQNEQEAVLNNQRDQGERERLIFKQLEDRQLLHRELKQLRQDHAQQTAELHRDIAGYLDRAGIQLPELGKDFQVVRGGEGQGLQR